MTHEALRAGSGAITVGAPPATALDTRIDERAINVDSLLPRDFGGECCKRSIPGQSRASGICFLDSHWSDRDRAMRSGRTLSVNASENRLLRIREGTQRRFQRKCPHQERETIFWGNAGVFRIFYLEVWPRETAVWSKWAMGLPAAAYHHSGSNRWSGFPVRARSESVQSRVGSRRIRGSIRFGWGKSIHLD